MNRPEDETGWIETGRSENGNALLFVDAGEAAYVAKLYHVRESKTAGDEIEYRMREVFGEPLYAGRRDSAELSLAFCVTKAAMAILRGAIYLRDQKKERRRVRCSPKTSSAQ